MPPARRSGDHDVLPVRLLRRSRTRVIGKGRQARVPLSTGERKQPPSSPTLPLGTNRERERRRSECFCFIRRERACPEARPACSLIVVAVA